MVRSAAPTPDDGPTQRAVRIETPPLQLPVVIRPAGAVTDDALYEFCRANPDLRIERSAAGEIIVMSPTGGATGRRNFTLIARFAAWAERDGSGVSFDSSTGFVLPNGAARSPDLAWVERSRWDALTADQQERLVPLCPDFAVELRSPSDSLSALRDKCAEYIACGARLVWLIDPVDRRVHVYTAEGCIVEDEPAALSGEPALPGLSVSLDDVL